MNTKKYIGKKVYLITGQEGVIRSVVFRGGKTIITVKTADTSDLFNWKKFSIDEIGVSIFPSAQQLNEHLEIQRRKIIEQKKEDEERRILTKIANQAKEAHVQHVGSLLSMKLPITLDTRHVRLMTVSECQQIRTILQERGIVELIHFTHVENLPKILEHGLLPPDEQKACFITSIHGDSCNHFLNAISLSVSFPNFQMFCAKHQKMTSNWVVISISPDILFENRSAVLFCYENAARFINKIPEDPEQFIGPNAFKRMFIENLPTYKIKNISRSDLALPAHFTSNPQAEILYNGKILINRIRRISVSHVSTYNNLIHDSRINLRNVELVLDDSFFAPRLDYEHWKKVNENGK